MALDPDIKAVGFDMDGTFMHTKVDYAGLSNMIYREFTSLGVPRDALKADGYKFSMELGKQWLKDNGMADAIPGVDERIARGATEIEMENVLAAEPFPGSLEVLSRLKDLGYKVGILTRGGRKYATTVLRENGILDEFDAVVARDDYPEDEAKPSPKAMEHLAQRLGVECSEVLFIGDGLVDYLTAKDSGARFIGVETGRNSLDDWREKVPADVCIMGSVADLLGRL